MKESCGRIAACLRKGVPQTKPDGVEKGKAHLEHLVGSIRVGRADAPGVDLETSSCALGAGSPNSSLPTPPARMEASPNRKLTHKFW